MVCNVDSCGCTQFLAPSPHDPYMCRCGHHWDNHVNAETSQPRPSVSDNVQAAFNHFASRGFSNYPVPRVVHTTGASCDSPVSPTSPSPSLAAFSPPTGAEGLGLASAGTPSTGTSASGTASVESHSYIEKQVAKLYEYETCQSFNESFHKILEGCKIDGGLRGREIIDHGVHLEIDGFAYVTHDSLCYGKSLPGFYTIAPRDDSKIPPCTSVRNQLAQSPDANLRAIPTSTLKYIIVEAYSGNERSWITKKVHQLEKKLRKMRKRHKKLSGSPSGVADITHIIGLAGLSFMTPAGVARGSYRGTCVSMVKDAVTKTGTPLLWRMAQSRRLVLTVLSQVDAATTSALRGLTVAMIENREEVNSKLEQMENRLISQQAIANAQRLDTSAMVVLMQAIWNRMEGGTRDENKPTPVVDNRSKPSDHPTPRNHSQSTDLPTPNKLDMRNTEEEE